MTYNLIGGKYISNTEKLMGNFPTRSQAQEEVQVDRGKFAIGYNISGESFDYYRIDYEVDK